MACCHAVAHSAPPHLYLPPVRPPTAPNLNEHRGSPPDQGPWVPTTDNRYAAKLTLKGLKGASSAFPWFLMRCRLRTSPGPGAGRGRSGLRQMGGARGGRGPRHGNQFGLLGTDTGQHLAVELLVCPREGAGGPHECLGTCAPQTLPWAGPRHCPARRLSDQQPTSSCDSSRGWSGV